MSDWICLRWVSVGFWKLFLRPPQLYQYQNVVDSLKLKRKFNQKLWKTTEVLITKINFDFLLMPANVRNVKKKMFWIWNLSSSRARLVVLNYQLVLLDWFIHAYPPLMRKRQWHFHDGRIVFTLNLTFTTKLNFTRIILRFAEAVIKTRNTIIDFLV